MTTFVDIIDRPETLTIDSYSSAKILNGVMHDIARLMKGICPREAKGFMINGKQDALDLLDCTSKDSEGGFFVEIEDVSCVMQYNEETDEMEYKDGYNYYFCTRVVK